MRYEDASQTGSMASDVNARDDTEHLAGNDFGPATGNLITGSGTVSGATGTDMVGPGGQITAIAGAGGSDNSFDANGNLEVAGQYGTLTIDAQGNYTYARNPDSPEGVSDTFNYTLANDAGATDSAKLVIAIGNPPILQAQGTQTIQTNNGVVVLPAGVELSDVRVVGRDLVITLPDGSTMVIPDGAIFVPQLVVNGVEVPASNLAALLIGSEPKPAAGDVGGSNQSSGGNFEVPVQPLDPGIPLGDLIPPTELDYTPPEFDDPGIEPEENEPPLIGTSSVNVSEEGVSVIAAANPDTTGSPDTTNSASNSGILPVSDPDGDSLTVTLSTAGLPTDLQSQGVTITWSVSPDGHTLTGSAGANPVITLVINDAGAYTVTLLRPVDHPTAGGEQGTSFVVAVSVSDGEVTTAGGTITVTIEDDSPTIVGQAAEPILITDDTTFNVNDTDAIGGAFAVSYGADGQAASNPITYAMGINAGATGLFDTLSGQQVVLTLVGGVVIGTAGAGGPEVFRVSVDGSGNVTLDQSRAVVHNDPADPLETNASGSAATLSADNLVTVSIVATDRDGDQASITVNIGQNLRFEDDGPSASVNGSVTEPVLVVDDTTLESNASASFAGLFNTGFGNDGAGPGGGISYALSITAGPSGIIDVATGEAVNLVMNGTVVEGRSAVTNQLVFTISVNGSGVVTLDQIRAVQHNDPADHDEPGASAATLSADSLVKLTVTVTDGDSDTATASLNIGQNFQFKDDGPSVTTSGTEPVLVVDDTTLLTNASGAFGGLFVPTYGADGPAAVNPIAYALSITAGPSGIVDVATGEAVNLVMNGAVVEGRTAIGNQLVFTVSVDGSGNVTLDQIRAVQHNDPADHDEPGASAATLSADNLIRLTATVTDRDGDTATATVNIGQNLQFKDDGPSVTTSGVEPTIVVDDTTLTTNGSASFAGLFIPNYGADGAATVNPITYALAITAGPSGIIDVATGQAVNLVMNGAVVEGRTAGSNDLVFTISVDASGLVTLDQIRAVQHNDPADHDEAGASAATLSADNLVRLTATVTDRDGDTATATINIGQNFQFKDDGPSASVNGSITEPVLVVDDTTLGTNASASFAGLFNTGFGNDGPATGGGLTYALAITPGASGIIDVATGEAVNLVMNGAVVEGRSAVTNQLVFTISVDGSGLVTLDQIRAVQHNDPADHDEPGASAATLSADSLVRLTVTATDKDGDTATATVNIGQNFQFKDDGPNASSSGTEPVLVVDDTTLLTNASATIADLFSGSFGADGPSGDGIAYTLAITAGPSGIIDVATGEAVNLVMNGAVVEGRSAVTNQLVFTVSVDGSGVLTLDQIRAVQHNDPADHDEPGASAATLSADNLIRLTATLTDKDGDSATVTINIGQNLQFKDDGPSVTTSGVEPTIVVDDTTLTTNGSASFAGLFVPNYGADGAAAVNPITYALAITAGPSGIIDVATGEAVNLVMNGAVVEGRTAIGNQLVFTVTVNGSGVVTVDQIRAVQHNDPADHDEAGASAATLTADNLIRLTATVTDRDGDTATATINIGSNLQFKDDGPSASVNGSITEPVLVVDDTTLLTNASASFAGLFNTGFGNDGPATGGGLTYALAITPGASGIIDVATGEAVNLVMNGAVVEGRSAVTNQLVFTISVDGSGLVTLDQIRAVQHNDPADHDEPGASAATLSADSLVRLTVTATDKDGDTATATVNIGQNFQFKDDGPSATTSGTEPVLVVDDTTLLTNASGAFGGLFIPTYGADGPAAVNPITYALAITAGPSGIIDVATGEAVNLVMNGAVVEGRTAVTNQLVFTVSVNGSGLVTLDQIRAVQHNDPADHDEPGASAATLSADNLIRLTATVTDRDGDTATATVNIGQNLQFKDDGPSVTTSGTEPVLVVDDTTLLTNASGAFGGLFVPTYGADGPAAVNPITYALAITAGPSGIVDVATGEAVNLVMNGAVVEGRTAIGNQLVFTVSVDGSGNVTLDQIRAVQHNDPADHDEPGASAATLSADNLIRLTATVTDRDGDTATATINIGQNLQFKDDGPSVTTSGVEPTIVVDDTTLTTNGSASFAGLFIPNYGADGAATVNPITYALAITAGPSGIIDVATGEAVNLVMNGAVVEGRSAVTNQLVFTVSVNGSGLVTLDQIRAVQHNDPADHDEPGASAATLTADNLIRLTATVTDRDGDTATATINIGSNLQFKDDGPSVTTSGTEPILVVDDTTLLTNASGAFGGLFVPNYGADGAAAVNPITYALAITAGPSGIIDVATGQAVNLVMNGSVVEGRTAISNQLVFTISVDGSGLVTLDQIRAVQHNDPADHDEPGASAATLSADNLVRLTATVTDRDGDTATATINIGQNLQFKDDGPSITTVTDPLNIDNDGTPSGLGDFVFSVGADVNGDFDDISVDGFTVTINSDPPVAATNVILTPGSEDQNAANYTFSFDYDTGNGGTQTATGTLIFYKTGPNAGKYEVALTSGPIQGVTLADTGSADVSDFIGFDAPGQGGGGSEFVNAQIAPTLFLQFSGGTVPNNGTFQTGDYPPIDPDPAPDGDPNLQWVEGELFTDNTAAFPAITISNAAIGVSSNVLQNEEVIDFNLYATDPGTAGPGGDPTTSSDEMFIRFDQISDVDDLIVILKLVDTVTGEYTTKAIVVDAADLYRGNSAADEAFLATTVYSGFSTMGNNEGLLIIQRNDYNGVGENWEIVGAQILVSPTDVSGTGINLNGDLNIDANGDGDFTDPGDTNGASTGTQAFSTDSDVGGAKIMSIGFLVPSTTAQSATIEFDVTVTDGDGDIAVRNDITVNIGTPPVVLDMDGDGTEFLDRSAGVAYDYGDGAVATAWAAADDAILVRDANGDGTVTDASEFVFGDADTTDMEALAAEYGEALDANDADFGKFMVWTDANSNGVADAGELQSLSAAGITSIGLVSDGVGYSAANGDVYVAGSGTYTRADGSTGATADAIFATGEAKATQEVERVAANSNSLTIAAALAAAGISSAAAAIEPDFADVGDGSAIGAISAQLSAGVIGSLTANSGPAFDIAGAGDSGLETALQAMSSSSHTAIAASQVGELVVVSPINDGPAALLDATDLATVLQMPTASNGMAVTQEVAATGAKADPAVGQIVLDALEGGAAVPSIDELLNALPGAGLGENAGPDSLASPIADNVPAWDTGNAGVFTNDAANIITVEAMVLHHDAVQPV